MHVIWHLRLYTMSISTGRIRPFDNSFSCEWRGHWSYLTIIAKVELKTKNQHSFRRIPWLRSLSCKRQPVQETIEVEADAKRRRNCFQIF